jgi:hypothetical protein
MRRETQNPSPKQLKQPLDEFFTRVSHPTNLSRVLNRLVYDGMLQGLVLTPDEVQNVHALSDFLLSCSQLLQSTSTVAEA